MTEQREKLKKYMDDPSSESSCFSCPEAPTNNWKENDWTQRLSWCLKSYHKEAAVHYTASIPFENVLALLSKSGHERFYICRGSPDILIHGKNIAILHFLEGESSADDPEDESSADETVEHCHQRTPLVGKGSSQLPEKLGEVIANTHFILVSKFIRRLCCNKDLGKTASANGLLLDKFVGGIHVSLSTGLFEVGVPLPINIKTISYFRNLDANAVCFHTRAVMRADSVNRIGPRQE